VTFSNFSFYNPASASFAINQGAVVTINSGVWFGGHDAIGGFLSVDHATLTVHGDVDFGSGGLLTLTNNATLNVSGPTAGVGLDSGITFASIDQTSRVLVSQGGGWRCDRVRRAKSTNHSSGGSSRGR